MNSGMHASGEKVGKWHIEFTLSSLLQVLQPFTHLLHSPEVLESPTLDEEAHNIILQVLQPIYTLLEASIQGNRSGEIFRRQKSSALRNYNQRCQGKGSLDEAALSIPFDADHVVQRDPGMVELRIT